MKKCLVLFCSTLVLVGCQSAGMKKTKAWFDETAGPAIAAALIGDAAKESDNKMLRMLAPVAVSILGNEIAKMLDQRDQEQMSDATITAAKTGKTQTWSNPETGASGRVEVKSTEQRTEQVSVPVLKGKVAHVPPLELIAATYAATTASVIRGGPATTYDRVGGLAEGAPIYVVGKVQGATWYFVAQGGVGTGFVHQSLLKPSSANVRVEKLDYADDQIEHKDVQASVECKTIEQSAALADGTSSSQTIKTCERPNGWAQQPV